MSKQKILSPEFRSTHKEPRNIIATDKVWCLNCSSYHSIDGIDNHLKLHCAIPPKFINSFSKPPPLQPVDIDIEFPTQLVAHRFDLDIQTMNAECLPLADTQRKKIIKPKPRALQPDCNRVPEVMLPVPSDLFEQATTEPSELRMHMEEFVTDEYYQEVNLQKMYVKVAPPITSRINPTDTARQRGEFDCHVERAKLPPSQKVSSKINKYKIELPSSRLERSLFNQTKIIAFVDDAKTLPGGDLTARITSRATSRNPTRRPSAVKRNNVIDENTPPKSYGMKLTNILSTCAASDVGNVNADSQITAPYTTYNRVNSRVEVNMSCSGCGGFYCPVCKSTVPPQFRPPPTEQYCCPAGYRLH